MHWSVDRIIPPKKLLTWNSNSKTWQKCWLCCHIRRNRVGWKEMFHWWGQNRFKQLLIYCFGNTAHPRITDPRIWIRGTVQLMAKVAQASVAANVLLWFCCRFFTLTLWSKILTLSSNSPTVYKGERSPNSTIALCFSINDDHFLFPFS